MASGAYSGRRQLIALLTVAALTVGVLALFDNDQDNALPTPTTVPAPTTTLPAIMRNGPWYVQFEQSGIKATSDEMRGARLASSMQFDADGFVRGGNGFGGGCDVFTAEYTMGGKTLSIGPLTGQLECTAVGALEIRNRLAAVASFELGDNALVLLGSDGARLLVCERFSIS
ncbi:MAG: META domain-containing protein [Acidimicrobiales bacterium]